MRLSALADDPDFSAYQDLLRSGKTARVFLNGIERTGVVTADEAGRFIVMTKRDEHGNLVPDASGENIAYETLLGDVHIEVCAF